MDLRSHLEDIDRIANEEWIANLEDRKKDELEFSNKHRGKDLDKDQDDYEKLYGNRKYYSTVQASNNYVEQWIKKNAKGKVFLDYACGDGMNAMRAAKAGADLSIGIDISDVSVQIAKDKYKLDNIFFLQADAENTKLPDSSIDVVICSGMLHHVELSYAFPELRRILKPRGKVLAVEALNYNPVIKLHRKLTPQMRTKWEAIHILSLKDVKFASRFFDIGEVKYWHITGIISPHLRSLAPVFESIDRILEKIPYIQRMAWIFTFELIKPR